MQKFGNTCFVMPKYISFTMPLVKDLLFFICEIIAKNIKPCHRKLNNRLILVIFVICITPVKAQRLIAKMWFGMKSPT